MVWLVSDGGATSLSSEPRRCRQDASYAFGRSQALKLLMETSATLWSNCILKRQDVFATVCRRYCNRG